MQGTGPLPTRRAAERVGVPMMNPMPAVVGKVAMLLPGQSRPTMLTLVRPDAPVDVAENGDVPAPPQMPLLGQLQPHQHPTPEQTAQTVEHLKQVQQQLQAQVQQLQQLQQMRAQQQAQQSQSQQPQVQPAQQMQPALQHVASHPPQQIQSQQMQIQPQHLQMQQLLPHHMHQMQLKMQPRQQMAPQPSHQTPKPKPPAAPSQPSTLAAPIAAAGPSAAPPAPPSPAPAASSSASASASAWTPGSAVEVRGETDACVLGAWVEAEVCSDDVASDAVRVRLRCLALEGKERTVRRGSVRARPPADTSVWAAGDLVEARLGGVWRNAEIAELAPSAALLGAPGVAPQPARQLALLKLLAHRLWVDSAALRRRSEPWKGANGLGLTVLSAERAAAAMGSDQARKRERSKEQRPREKVRQRAADGESPAAGPSPVDGAAKPPGRAAGGLALRRSSSGDPSPRLRGILDGLRADFLQPAACGNGRLRWEIPAGVKGGQTLLLSVRRQPELLEVEVPEGAVAGTVLLAHTSLGHIVHVPTPPNAPPGARLLVSVPLPPQGIHVKLPAAAKPGSAVTLTLPKPIVAVTDDQKARDRSLKRPGGSAHGSGHLLHASGSGDGGKRARRNSACDAAALEVSEEAHGCLRALAPCGRDTEVRARTNVRVVGQLAELHASPEMVEAWILCEVLLKRLHHPSPSLPELERWLCAMPKLYAVGAVVAEPSRPGEAEASSSGAVAATPSEGLADALPVGQAAAPTEGQTAAPPQGRSTATAVRPDDLGAMYSTLLLQLLREGTPAAAEVEDGAEMLADCGAEDWLRHDGWIHAIGVALRAGLWEKAYPDVACPFVVVEPPAEPETDDKTTTENHKNSKFGEWVTEIGPPLCGTFGCILPNNHAGLHQLPESERGDRAGRLRRDPSQESTSGGAPSALGREASSGEGGAGGAPCSADALLAAVAAALSQAAAASFEERTEGLAPYTEARPVDRLLALRALCLGLLTPSERKKVRSAGARLHLGSCLEADYWALPSAARVYRTARPPGTAELPVGALWEPVSLERDDFVAFGTTLAHCCVAHADASRTVAACHAALGRLRERVPAADHAFLEPPPPPEPVWQPEPEPAPKPHKPKPAAAPRAAPADHHPRPDRRAGAGQSAEQKRDRSAAAAAGAAGGSGSRRAAGEVSHAAAAVAAGAGSSQAADEGVGDGDDCDERQPSPPHVRVQLRAQRVPVGHRQMAVRACLKLSVPRQRKLSSTLRFHQQDVGLQHWHDPRAPKR